MRGRQDANGVDLVRRFDSAAWRMDTGGKARVRADIEILGGGAGGALLGARRVYPRDGVG